MPRGLAKPSVTAAGGGFALFPKTSFSLTNAGFVVRGTDIYHAFNNACPHLHLPLYERRSSAQAEKLKLPHTESTITGDLGLVCRWHQSCFDLLTGEIREWAQLEQDGTRTGLEYLGDISKNRAKLIVYPCRVQDGFVWIGLE